LDDAKAIDAAILANDLAHLLFSKFDAVLMEIIFI
jgi:hypothetical protein